jgi:hypothetical protein
MWLLYEYPTLLLAMPALIKKWSVMTAAQRLKQERVSTILGRSTLEGVCCVDEL